MPEWYEVCRYCQRAFDFAGPAIVLHGIPQYEFVDGGLARRLRGRSPEMRQRGQL